MLRTALVAVAEITSLATFSAMIAIWMLISRPELSPAFHRPFDRRTPIRSAASRVARRGVRW